MFIILKRALFCALLTGLPWFAYCQFEFPASRWADSVFAKMDYEERLGQLFMVAAYSNKDSTHLIHLDSLVEKYKVGGLIFFQGGPKRQISMTRRFQSKASIPLFIGFDGEWGLQMRLDSTMYFPRQMTLGAIQNKDLIEKMGSMIAKHCSILGIHINFAPDIDVNNNPNNPVIGVRSFGENKIEVAERGILYMQGMQKNGIMATAKHFPGHGDTDADSHYDLPVIRHDKRRLDDIELYPFKRLFKAGIHSVMVAHLHVPSLDARPNTATTLSKAVVQDLLKKNLGFKGLIFTDALNMKGVSKYYPPGEVDVLALKAGNDVLLFAENVPRAMTMIKQAIANKSLDSVQVMLSVMKILRAKAYYNLPNQSLPDTNQIMAKLWQQEAVQLQEDLYAHAATLLRNKENLMPINELSMHKVAWVTIGNNPITLPGTLANYYAPVKQIYLSHSLFKNPNSETILQPLLDSLKEYTRIICSVHDLSNKRKENFGISEQLVNWHKKVQQNTPTITIYHGNTFGLPAWSHAQVLLHMYEDNEVTRTLAPQFVFGAKSVNGKLPLSLLPDFNRLSGIETKPLQKIQLQTTSLFTPQPNWVFSLDSLVNNAILEGATPGARLMVVHKGKIVVDKCYGHLSYDKTTPVDKNTVYDIASVTKTSATIPALMLLHQWGDIPLDKTLTHWLPETKGTDKQNLILKDILLHQSGLVPFADFSKRAFSISGLNTTIKVKQMAPLVKLIEPDTLFQWVLRTPLQNFKSDTGCYPYKYSDMGYYFLQRIIEKETKQKLSVFLDQNLYKPLGIQLTFNPKNQFLLSKIAPSEEDYSLRNTTVRGEVHDPNAWLVSGFAAHAGLFARAQDLAVLGQLFAQKGTYGNRTWYKRSTLEIFTKPHYSQNRRALGWDRPFPPDEMSLADPSAFGHTGFTGTAWWIDPSNELVFVFLSNRTYPFSDNKKLTTLSLRTHLLNQVYKGLVYQKP